MAESALQPPQSSSRRWRAAMPSTDPSVGLGV
jgi:hypothetical protein